MLSQRLLVSKSISRYLKSRRCKECLQCRLLAQHLDQQLDGSFGGRPRSALVKPHCSVRLSRQCPVWAVSDLRLIGANLCPPLEMAMTFPDRVWRTQRPPAALLLILG